MSCSNGLRLFADTVMDGLASIFSISGLGVINNMAARLFVAKDASNFGGVNYNGVTNKIEIYSALPYAARISIDPSDGSVTIPTLIATKNVGYATIAVGSSIAVTFATANTFTRLNSGFTLVYGNGLALTNGRLLTYTGVSGVGKVSADISFTNTSLLVSDTIQFAIVKNATVNGSNEYTAGTVYNPVIATGFLTGNNGNVSVTAIDSAMVSGDNYSLFVKNVTDTTTVTCTGCNWIVERL